MPRSLYVATAESCAAICCNDTPSPFTIPAKARHRRVRRPRPPLRSTSSEISDLFGSNGYSSSCHTSRQNSVDVVQGVISTVHQSQSSDEPDSYLSNSATTKISEPQRSKNITEGRGKETREDSGVSIGEWSPRRTSTPVEASSISHDFAYDESEDGQVELGPALKGRLDPLALTKAINFLTLGEADLRQAELGSRQLDDQPQKWTPASRVEPGVVVCDGVYWLPKDYSHCQCPEWDGTAHSRKCSLVRRTSTSASAWKVTTAGIVPAQSCPSLSDASGSPVSHFPPPPPPSDDNISITAIAPFSRRASRRNSEASDDSTSLSSALPSTTAFNDSTTSPPSLPDLSPQYCDAIVDWAAAAHDMHDATSEYALEQSRQRANKASKAMKRSLDTAFAKEFNSKRQKIREERKRRQSATTTGYASSPYVSEDEMMLEEDFGLEEGVRRRGERFGSIDEEWLQPERTEYFVLT